MTDRDETHEIFSLPHLPYELNALSPYLSSEAIDTHYSRHHTRYVETLNRLVENLKNPPSTLETLIRSSYQSDIPLFNNAAQAWNHAFFWESMSPQPTKPDGKLRDAISRNFGSIEALKQQFIAGGTGHFGSGWVWLVSRNGDLSVAATHDAGNPITEDGLTPLLTCDVWEHAYYIDYRHNRADWLLTWWDHLANWHFAEKQYEASLGKARGWVFTDSGNTSRR
ncbi:superoxide dismutase [Parvibaculum sp.]|uniref:superoxide dismutase n=1 Tax=Parvibaculum sp. TaxID=2024848 RepID=UPI001DD2A2F5|nr:superoxide dismutase [Parvibaculum sp.]MBX3488702.1 superoxide dismutase [Parvibaculum sp.]MCW5727416.1 superoxide dismutase [Parvibaculum sp.]